MMPYLKTETRKEAYGHTWEWREANSMMRAHWKSTKGNLVLVFPPSENVSAWFVNVCDDECYDLIGDDVEARTFAIAVGFTEQDRSR
jgi:hypothetical protein